MMFVSLDCCAVNPVNTTTNNFDNTPWCTTSGECQQTNAEIPKTCCKGVTKTNYTSAPSTCFFNLNPGSYITKGCYQAIREFLKENITSKSPVVLAVGIIIFLVEVLSVITSVALCRQSFKD
ncbi:uncharacterized protein LOC134277470 [Saccostrea cucullata]|uniref:uncharacterized protein LOC134277470 n=1 Tax=Saccostrea cuccullata TaxID=36930 RepID=UPI002ED5EC6D